MQMHWLMERNIFNEEKYDAFVKCLSEKGIPHSIHRVVPFTHSIEDIKSIRTTNVFPFGSVNMMNSPQIDSNWFPGVLYLDCDRFKNQLLHYGTNLLNHDAQVSTLGNVAYQTKNLDELMFVRSDSAMGFIRGSVYNKAAMQAIYYEHTANGEWTGSYHKHDEPVIYAAPKTIHSEHRFWIVDAKIVTASTYRNKGRSCIQRLPDDNRFVPFVESMIAVHNPSIAYVMDVADTPDGFKIIEFNVINSCGFYDCDEVKLIESLQKTFSI